MTLIAESGKCRVCGCTEFEPCLGIAVPGEPLPSCYWMDAAKTLCSDVSCVAVIPLDELIELCEAA